MRARARELGVVLGAMQPGPLNAITDVRGVAVGHVTCWEGESVRTGVTVVLPHTGNMFREKVPAAVEVINAFGKMTGTTQIEELGVIETPIALTNTLCVGRAFDGLVSDALRKNPEIGVTTGSVNPVVAECNDGWLNDLRGRHVTAEDVLAAIDRAQGGPVEEGAAGAGTGMMAFGWKGGIGTSSRLVCEGFSVGVLVLANYGSAEELTIAGVPVGRLLPPPWEEPVPPGSCIVIIATDTPLDARQLGRVARRAQSGLARTGTVSGHGSGEYALAFSTARKLPHWEEGVARSTRTLIERGDLMHDLLTGTVEATEEAAINALFAAETVRGRDGHVARGLPVPEVLTLLRKHAFRLQ